MTDPMTLTERVARAICSGQMFDLSEQFGDIGRVPRAFAPPAGTLTTAMEVAMANTAVITPGWHGPASRALIARVGDRVKTAIRLGTMIRPDT